MTILGVVNGVFSFIFNGTLWLGLVIGYILGRKFYKPIEDLVKRSINNIRKKGVKSNG